MVLQSRRAESSGSPALYVTGLLVGAALFGAVASIDVARVLNLFRFPAGELNNRWVVADLTTLRGVALTAAVLLMVSSALLWKFRDAVQRASDRTLTIIASAGRLPLLIPATLTGVVLVKTVVQLGLYIGGYSVYAADDFSRSLSADYWLQHLQFDFGAGGWVGLRDSAWLPLSDYLFGLGLALHRDIFLTPKFVNLVLSGALVVVAYLLGRELFGRLAGLVTAVLVAFQPWYVWLGFSGMTSDLPSAVLLALCGLFLVRWLRTESPHALLGAAGALAAADGFRYENWLFSGVFSLLVVYIAVSRREQARWRRQLVATASALALANAVPIAWMTASRIALGVWLPALRVVNAYSDLAFSSSSTTPATTINIPLFVMGCFPFEIALAAAGMVMFLRSSEDRAIRPYLILPIATFLLFATTFNWRVPAWLMIGRYFLTFVVLLAPFAGFFLAQLLRSAAPRRLERFAAAFVIVASLAVLDLGRIGNYPAMFPRDAMNVGWTLRGLQATGTIPADAKILIEKAQDWGHLGIVVMANKPERFALLGDRSHERSAEVGPDGSPVAGGLAVGACGDDVGSVACRDGVVRDGYALVILSSEKRVETFKTTFPSESWRIGRYHVFNVGTASSSE